MPPIPEQTEIVLIQVHVSTLNLGPPKPFCINPVGHGLALVVLRLACATTAEQGVFKGFLTWYLTGHLVFRKTLARAAFWAVNSIEFLVHFAPTGGVRNQKIDLP